MRLVVLASGSSGNALIVEAGGSAILIDCGVSCRQIERRMHAAGLQPERLAAVVLTHEHSDHIQGLEVFLRRYPLPVAATAGTAEACHGLFTPELVLQSGREVVLDGLRVLPFAVSHDAREPVGLVVEHAGRRAGLLTDCGVATALAVERLAACEALLLEANHDRDLLRQGPYPWALKQRIASRFGHLSNEQAQQLLDRLAHPGLQVVVGMHLSRENNSPVLVRQELGRALEGSAVRLEVARQDEPLTVELG